MNNKLLTLLVIFYSGVSIAQSSLNSLEELKKYYLINNKKPIRLHLGCGEKYLPNYINIDFPPSNHSVQTNLYADFITDISKLNFPNESINEIRSHHLFEHFDRATALATLCKWHQFLKIGGTIHIETPDFEAAAQAFLSNNSIPTQQKILRHLYGSQEAFWALHYDGWYSKKYDYVLKKLGFSSIAINKSKWKDTYNITITAKKEKKLTAPEYTVIASEVLKDCCVDSTESEKKMHAVWLAAFQKAFNQTNQKQEITYKKYILITSLYNEKNLTRVQEYITCLQKNLAHPSIEKIHILYDTSNDTKDNPSALLEFIKNNSIEVTLIEKRATYQDCFNLANNSYLNSTIIVSNGDIYFNESLNSLNNYDLTNKFLALTRWNLTENNNLVQTYGTANKPLYCAQDAWIFTSPLKPFPNAHISLGILGCDCAIALQAKKAGLTVLNPCLSIQCCHLHLSAIHNYPKTGYKEFTELPWCTL